MLESILGSHSAEVEMWLDCGEHGKAKLRRIAPNSVVLWESFNAPPCDADLIVQVDGKSMTRRVKVGGLSANRLVAKIFLATESIAPF